LVDQKYRFTYNSGTVNNKEPHMPRQHDLDYAQKKRDAFYVDETQSEFGPHVRWRSNDRVPFDDMLECFQALGWIDLQTRENSAVVRYAEERAFLAEYRQNFKGYDAETLAEMRSEFGAGARVVNVVTGTVTQL
jgi:hypothetical protein